jgi:hypothetical protein
MYAYFTNEYLFLANLLLFIGCLQTEVLLLRLLFIAAYTFFIIFYLTLGGSSLDSFLFSILFLIINIYLTIPIINSIIPPDFNPEDKEMYINQFINYLTKRELEEFLKIGKRKVFRVSSNLVKMGHEFSTIYLITKIDNNCKVKLKSNLGKLILSEYSWIGIPEYLNRISSVDDYRNEYKVSIKLEVENINDNLHDDNTILMYAFELTDINKLFENQQNIMRGLYSIWLRHCTLLIKQKDIQKVEYIDGKKSKMIWKKN